jgi:hypothetical protein
VRAAVMGLGNQARVQVKLTDDTTLDGRISQIAAEYFVITDARSGSLITLSYPEVKQVKRNNLSKGEKVGIGVAIGVGVGILIAVLAGRNKNSDNNVPKCGQTQQVGVPCPPGCVCVAQ